MPQPRLAVLIDAENVSHHLARPLFDEVARFGVPQVRRLYGDFKGPASGWDKAVARFALDPRHCFAPARGKNGTDITLAIDAMDLLHGGGIDGFCIASSDGDFAALAGRIRRQGVRVYGFGNGAERFRIACSEYVVLVQPEKKTEPKVVVAEPHAALPGIRSVLEKMQSRDGWYCLAAFGSEARRAGVDPKRFGAAKLSSLLRATGQYEIEDGKPPHRFRLVTLRAVAGG